MNVGDRVMTPFGIGTIIKITDNRDPDYLVYHPKWGNGHDGDVDIDPKYKGDHCWYYGEREISLLKATLTEYEELDEEELI